MLPLHRLMCGIGPESAPMVPFEDSPKRSRGRPAPEDIHILPEAEVGHVAGKQEILALCDTFPREAYSVSGNARRAARQGGALNVTHLASNKRINIIVRRGDVWGREYIAWHKEEFSRQRRVRAEVLPGLHGDLASPEDVILGKMWQYGFPARLRLEHRRKHLGDIAAVIQVSAGEFERSYVNQWANRLSLSDVWDAILSRLSSET